MSKVKIYNGVTIDMSTSQVIGQGEVSYIDSSGVAYCGGGGGGGAGTTNTVSGYADPYNSQIGSAIGAGTNLYNQGQLGQVAGFNQNQIASQQAGMAAGTAQTGLEQAMATQANKDVDLSGMRTGAKQQALQALNMNAANAGRAGGLGGSRQYLNNQSVANDLAAKFGTIDMQAQNYKMANRAEAIKAQGTGAQTQAAVGMGQQQQTQNQLDSGYAGLSQLSNIYGGFMPKQTNVTSKQGGGK
jgi:hypothetical protein